MRHPKPKRRASWTEQGTPHQHQQSKKKELARRQRKALVGKLRGDLERRREHQARANLERKLMVATKAGDCDRMRSAARALQHRVTGGSQTTVHLRDLRDGLDRNLMHLVRGWCVCVRARVHACAFFLQRAA